MKIKSPKPRLSKIQKKSVENDISRPLFSELSPFIRDKTNEALEKHFKKLFSHTKRYSLISSPKKSEVRSARNSETKLSRNIKIPELKLKKRSTSSSLNKGWELCRLLFPYQQPSTDRTTATSFSQRKSMKLDLSYENSSSTPLPQRKKSSYRNNPYLKNIVLDYPYTPTLPKSNRRHNYSFSKIAEEKKWHAELSDIEKILYKL
ncbi:unnamed protein product [Blepharisma stoltei]|uniref:Uncharacterized protein n=1 Tax=Blepharisma stoltei TaxID=1481888 RepID=A0AAU9IR96_9CILI|nr:unnamed protein product [Blepharisma stoltei]